MIRNRLNTLRGEELLKKAISIWGAKSQCAMIQEEATELALAMHKLNNRVGGRTHPKAKFKNDVIDEIADMSIMIEQARIMFGCGEIDKRINFKMKRLEEKIESNV